VWGAKIQVSPSERADLQARRLNAPHTSVAGRFLAVVRRVSRSKLTAGAGRLILVCGALSDGSVLLLRLSSNPLP